MSETKNQRAIENALSKFIKRKNDSCLWFLKNFMKDLVDYAMELHNTADPETGKQHTFHSKKLGNDFGWCIAHNGVLVYSEMGYGAETSRVAEMEREFNMICQRSANQWIGGIVSNISPIKLKNGKELQFSERFESWVFENLDSLAKDNAREAFTMAIHSTR